MKWSAAVLLEGGGGLPDTNSGGRYVQLGVIVSILCGGSEGWGQPNNVFRVKFIVINLLQVLVWHGTEAVGAFVRGFSRESYAS